MWPERHEHRSNRGYGGVGPASRDVESRGEADLRLVSVVVGMIAGALAGARAGAGAVAGSRTWPCGVL